MNSKLRQLRRESGLTQKELANEIGSTDKNIWAYEKGVATPPIDVIVAYAEFFEVTTDYLLGVTDEFGTKYKDSRFTSFSNEEIHLIENYRELNPMSKKLVKQTMETLRASSEQHELNKDKKG